MRKKSSLLAHAFAYKWIPLWVAFVSALGNIAAALIGKL
jgi:hypothetical protein